MFHPKNKWPTTKAANGTKFFAQSMRAFLDKESFEGFRAYSLDTIGRLREAAALIEDILAKRIKEPALSSVLAELVWSIENDDAASNIAASECSIFIDMCRDGKTHKQTLLHGCRMLESKLKRDYRSRLIDRVIKAINDDKRIEILTAVGYLVSHLLNEGHNRDYIIDRIDDKFFDGEVKKVGASVVRSFLRGITEKPRRWVVVHRVNPTASRLLKEFDTWTVTPIAGLPAHAQVPISVWPDTLPTSIFASRRTLASDPFQAAVHVRQQLEEVKSLRLLAVDPLSLEWSDQSYVYLPRAKDGHELITWDAPLLGVPTTKTIAGHRLSQARKLASRLYKNLDDSSQERITRALSTGAVAIDSPQEEIRLTSLWASLEVLLGDPPEENSRISHFVRTLAPCVSVKYHRRVFVVLHDQLAVHYRKKFRAILSQVPTQIKSNDHTKFAKMVLMEENEALLKQVFTLSADNPYLVHRVWRLYKYYREPADCLKTIKAHYDRVVWQMNRIYRVRNSLVHLGRSPSYTDTLVLNALEYLRSTVITTVRMSSRYEVRQDLDQVIAEVGFEWQSILKQLEAAKTRKFDEALAHRVFAAL